MQEYQNSQMTIDAAIYTAAECDCHASSGVCVKFGEQLDIPKRLSKNTSFSQCKQVSILRQSVLTVEFQRKSIIQLCNAALLIWRRLPEFSEVMFNAGVTAVG